MKRLTDELPSEFQPDQKRSKDSDSTLVLLSEELMGQGREDEAELMLLNAIKLNRENIEAREALINLYALYAKKAPKTSAAHYAYDKNQLNLEEVAKCADGQYLKISRRLYPSLTHSYFWTPTGELLQQVHKSQGSVAHQPRDYHPVIIGGGGFKTVKAMADATGHVSDVRAVVDDDSSLVRPVEGVESTISASYNESFKSNENLLVGSYFSYTSAKTGKIKQVFFSPYYADGDLKGKKFTIAEARSIALRVAQGLQVVHSEGWAHLDIKLDNIIGYKLADFDMAVDFHTADENEMIKWGTIDYEAPEIGRDTCCGKEAAQQADMYGFGIVMFKLVAGLLTHPGVYDGMNEEARIEFTSDAERELGYPLSYQDLEYLNLVWDLMNQDPTKRPSVDAVIQGLKIQ